MKTIKEAKEQTIFYTENGKVIESNLYDYLCEYGQGDDTSAVEEEEITTWLVDGSRFNSEFDAQEFCDDNEIDNAAIEEETITHYSHVVRYHSNYGRKIKGSTNFYEDQEAAEAAFIEGLEWYVSSKNWDAPEYFDSEEEAEERRIEYAAEGMGLDREVFLSIERKERIIHNIRYNRLIADTAAYNAQQEVVFEKYKDLIQRFEPETYNETKMRLSTALPEKIHSGTFHKIIKYIRK